MWDVRLSVLLCFWLFNSTFNILMIVSRTRRRSEAILFFHCFISAASYENEMVCSDSLARLIKLESWDGCMAAVFTSSWLPRWNLMHVFAILKDSFWSGAERDACVPSIRDCHISFKKDICLKVTFSPMDVLHICIVGLHWLSVALARLKNLQRNWCEDSVSYQITVSNEVVCHSLQYALGGTDRPLTWLLLHTGWFIIPHHAH